MTFHHPWVLLFLVLPAGLIFWEAVREGYRIVLPFDHGEQKEGRWLYRLLLAFNVVPALLLSLVILILAHPYRLGKAEQKRRLTNIEFCLDVSGSMTARFGQEGTQYDAAMKAIEDFTSRRKGDAFGLTIFGNEVLRWVPLTKDLTAIRMATPFLRPGKLPHHFGGTEIGKALRSCARTLSKQETGDRLIILLSDGHSADLWGKAPHEIANLLQDASIRVFAIHIGDGAAPGPLHTISSATGGMVYAVNDPAALKAVFGHIDRMQPTKLEPRARRRISAYQPYALAGLFLAGAYLIGLCGIRYTPW